MYNVSMNPLLYVLHAALYTTNYSAVVLFVLPHPQISTNIVVANFLHPQLSMAECTWSRVLTALLRAHELTDASDWLMLL